MPRSGLEFTSRGSVGRAHLGAAPSGTHTRCDLSVAALVYAPRVPLTPAELEEIVARTVGHYDAHAARFWEGTKDHDVSQNLEAMLSHLDAAPPLRVLDFGCGPGRDLLALTARGHEAVGLDGSIELVRMARAQTGCEVLHQSFLALELGAEAFDGVFANASLFHIPRQELGRVVAQLFRALRPGGVLFCSNPRGDDREGWSGERYGTYLGVEAWRAVLGGAGFDELDCYYRPSGRPRAEQPWLAMVWRKPSS